MEAVAWSDALMTGVDVIDRQHRGLVDMINATAARLDGQSGLSADEVRALVRYLKDYTEVHFSTEEALMSLCGLSPAYAQAHHHNHERFLQHVGDLLDELGEDAVPDGRQLLAFLGDWLIRHISGEDQGLARRLRDARQVNGAGADAVPSPPRPVAAPAAPMVFADAVTRGSASLHESEADVRGFIAGERSAAVVIGLDASLLPTTVCQANPAAQTRFASGGSTLTGLRCETLFSAAQWQRMPVIMSEVLMHGSFEGGLECVCADGVLRPFTARITHLVLDGQIVILLVFAGAEAVPGRAAVDVAARRETDNGGDTALSRHALFERLAVDERAGLEQAATLVRLRKGDVLYAGGTHPAGLYIVISGQLGLIASNDRGEEKVLDIVVSEQVLGETEVLTARPSSMTARSLSASVLLLIPAERIRHLQDTSRVFSNAVATYLGHRLHRRAEEIAALTLHTAMERTIDFILDHASGPASDNGALESVLPAPKGVVASYLDISAATLSRAFQQLSDAGLISVNRRYVTIADRERLLRFRAEGGGDGRT